jgi:hypothetical protein
VEGSDLEGTVGVGTVMVTFVGALGRAVGADGKVTVAIPLMGTIGVA